MSNHPATPKTPYKNNNPFTPKNSWDRSLKQRPTFSQTRQSHIPMGMGKHRKSFGHV